MSHSPMITEELTFHQLDFVENFNGSIKQTADKMGCNYCYLRQLMMKPKIRKAIQRRLEEKNKVGVVADILEMQMRLTEIIREEDARQPGEIPVDRDVWLKCIKLLGSSQCMFSEKRVIEGGDKPVNLIVREVDVMDRIRQQIEDDDDI